MKKTLCVVVPIGVAVALLKAADFGRFHIERSMTDPFAGFDELSLAVLVGMVGLVPACLLLVSRWRFFWLASGAAVVGAAFIPIQLFDSTELFPVAVALLMSLLPAVALALAGGLAQVLMRAFGYSHRRVALTAAVAGMAVLSLQASGLVRIVLMNHSPYFVELVIDYEQSLEGCRFFFISLAAGLLVQRLLLSPERDFSVSALATVGICGLAVPFAFGAMSWAMLPVPGLYDLPPIAYEAVVMSLQYGIAILGLWLGGRIWGDRGTDAPAADAEGTGPGSEQR